MSRPTAQEHQAARRAAVKLASEGLATAAEIARLVGTSRQLVREVWLKGIDVQGRRQAHLQKLWRAALKQCR
jgi:DNA invertase Pin-like site-specific DNA recombinase